MLCFMASKTNWFAACSQFRMPSPGWLLAPCRQSDHISPVLRQLHWLPVRQCVVFKVYQSLSGHAPGYWSTTVNSSSTYLSDNCVLLTLERLLSTGRPAVSETGPSQLLEPECGTVCHQTWDNRDCAIFIWTTWDQGAVWTLLTAPSRNILTYLFT